MRKIVVLTALLILLLALWGAFSPRLKDVLKIPIPQERMGKDEQVRVVSEESIVIEVVDKVTPSVVTVGVEKRILQLDPFDPFGFFRRPGTTRKEQDIGSGFVLSEDGLIVTNKHVVSAQGKYKVITSDGKKFDVVRIYRDPSNDIAILKIDPSSAGLRPVEMGDSSNIKVGQMVVAIGTPLGEFRGSVTKGIVSGLGRGITAGSPFEGFAEKLDDVIQTDAAINPGNSGGPLVNSSGQVIGVNTAIASGAENIGFAIPINVVKEALDNFNKTGGFSRPYLGVAYQMVTRELSVLNEIPEGAFVQELVEGHAADKAGVKEGDIITEIDGKRITEDSGGLAKIISEKKVGQEVTLTVWRDRKELELKATLDEVPAE